MEASPAPGSDGRVIDGIDHVYARVEDAGSLFAALNQRLGLPRSYGFARLPGFEGGAVSIGNMVFLEALRYAPGRKLPAPASPGLDGLALAAARPLAQAATELSRRRIPHSPPLSYVGDPDAFSFGATLRNAGLRTGRGPLWSMVVLGDFFGDRKRGRLFRAIPSRGDSRMALAFGRVAGRLMSSERFADRAMSKAITSRPTVWVHQFEAADMGAAKTAAAAELAACDGGKLGMTGVKEVVVGARDLAAECDRWQRLLHPIRPRLDDNVWHLGDGPALRLVEDEKDRIKCLVCEVSSLQQAEEFLRHEGMLGTTSDTTVRIAPTALHDVDIRLVQHVPETANTDGAPWHQASSD